MIMSFDLETIPRMKNETFKIYEQEAKKKIMNNRSIKKASTRNKKLAKVDEKMALARSGYPSDDMIKKLSFDPILNQICGIAITYADPTDDFKIKTISKVGDNEKELLQLFIDFIGENGLPTYLGHNIVLFDCPTIRNSLLYHGMLRDIYVPAHGRQEIFPTYPFHDCYIDTYRIFDCSLDKACQVFLGEAKVTDGSKVWKMYNNKEWDKLDEYVRDDSIKPYKLYQKYKGDDYIR